MDEKKNHINRKLSEQLPSHSPDKGTWQRLSDKLDVVDAETAYQEKLQGLPVHSPDQGTWPLILSRLNRIGYYKTGIRIALSVAAGLLLFFTVSRLSDQYQSATNIAPQVAKQEKFTESPASSRQTNILPPEETGTRESIHKSGNIQSDNYVAVSASGIQKHTKVKSESQTGLSTIRIPANPEGIQKSTAVVTGPETLLSENKNIIIAQSTGNETKVPSVNSTGQLTENMAIQDTSSPAIGIINAGNETESVLFQKEQYVVNPIVANTAHVESKPVNSRNHFALDMNYLPENIYNGTNNSLFHNVDLTASYNKGKVRFNTSLGMAYNEEQLKFQVSYDINTPVTALGQGGKLDTLSFSSANMDSQYTGNEKHQYFTYNLGVGRQLISSGKFSTWLNLGAGFGVLLNNPDLIAETANSVKTMYNAQIVNVNSSKPVYNDVNVNFVTAIDFNYKIISRLSITFTPTSRWYLKPVLSVDNQSTDKFTLGFRTGMKFEF
jgi:hypothetical protein